MEERFSGLMLPLARGSLPDFGAVSERYASDLKREAERVAHDLKAMPPRKRRSNDTFGIHARFVSVGMDIKQEIDWLSRNGVRFSIAISRTGYTVKLGNYLRERTPTFEAETFEEAVTRLRSHIDLAPARRRITGVPPLSRGRE
jgi:hypothetical protein